MLLFTLPVFLLGRAVARLVEATAYRLRYELTSTAAPLEKLVIGNSGAPSPDLKTDNLPPSCPSESPLRNLINASVKNQEQARAVLLGHQHVGGAPEVTNLYRAHMTITPREAPPPTPQSPFVIPAWCVDANEGAAAGDPASANRVVVVAQGPAIVGYTAELEICVPHSTSC
jgi:hypothetical protein